MKHEKLMTEYEHTTNALNDSRATIASLEDELAKGVNETRSLLSELKDSENIWKDYEREVKTLQKCINNITDSLREQEKLTRDAEIENGELNSRLCRLIADESLLKELVNDLQSQVAIKDDELESANEELSTLQTTLKRVKEVIEEYERTMNDLEVDRDNLKNQLANANEMIDGLNLSMNNTSADLRKVKADHENELSALVSEHHDSMTELAEKYAELTRREFSALEHVKHLENQLNKSEEQKQRYMSELRTLTDDLEKKRKKLEEEISNNADKDATVKQLQSAKEELEKLLAEREDQYQELSVESQRLRDFVAELEAEFKELSDELEKKIKDSEAKRDHAEKILADQEQRALDLENAYNEIQSQLIQRDDELRRLLDADIALQKERDSLQEELTALTQGFEKLEGLGDEYHSMLDKLLLLQKKLTDTEEALHEAEQERDHIKSQFISSVPSQMANDLNVAREKIAALEAILNLAEKSRERAEQERRDMEQGMALLSAQCRELINQEQRFNEMKEELTKMGDALREAREKEYNSQMELKQLQKQGFNNKQSGDEVESLKKTNERLKEEVAKIKYQCNTVCRNKLREAASRQRQLEQTLNETRTELLDTNEQFSNYIELSSNVSGLTPASVRRDTVRGRSPLNTSDYLGASPNTQFLTSVLPKGTPMITSRGSSRHPPSGSGPNEAKTRKDR